MTKAEEIQIIRVCGKDYEYLDIPTYIRKRDEDEARALCQLEEQGIQEAREEKAKEKLEMNKE